jgi:hypothetical protein
MLLLRQQRCIMQANCKKRWLYFEVTSVKERVGSVGSLSFDLLKLFRCIFAVQRFWISFHLFISRRNKPGESKSSAMSDRLTVIDNYERG